METKADWPVVSFIGGGNMALAIASGLLGAGWAPGALRVADPDPTQLRRFRDRAAGIHTTTRNGEALAGVDALVLAVKPQVLPEILATLPLDELPPDCVIISVAAGTRIATIEAAIGNRACVRCMPNQGALVGAGATGMFANAQCSDDQRGLAERLLGATGPAVWLEDESLIDVVTAVSGSGPAYFYALMEALIDSAAQLGLPSGAADTLVRATILGAATLAEDASTPIATLRERVTSPGGTTAAGLAALDAHQFHDTIAKVVTAAHARALQLATAT